MADFSDSTLTVGTINFAPKVNNFVDHCEDFATEIEDARINNSLQGTLNSYYAKYNLLDSISGNINISNARFINMPDAVEDFEYITKGQMEYWLDIPNITSIDICDSNSTPRDCSAGLDIPYAPFLLKTINYPLDDDTYDVFDYASDNLTLDSSNTFYYPTKYNKTYYLDWNTANPSAHEVRLYKTGVTLSNGAKIRLIFKDIALSTDGIIDNINKIWGSKKKVEFGDTFNFVVLDLVYDVTSNNGWHFTNGYYG